MTTWSIEVTLDLGHRPTADEAINLEGISNESIAVTASPAGLVANAWHEAAHWTDADEYASKVVWQLKDALDDSAEVIEVRVRTEEQVEAEIARPTMPRLLGASEVGDLLGISRQRVHQLSQLNATFPAPLVEVAMGPLWDERAIEKFNRQWTRQVGRPRTRIATPVQPKNQQPKKSQPSEV